MWGLCSFGKKCCLADTFVRSVRDGVAVSGSPTRMHNPLGNALMIEVSDLLPEMMILKERRTTFADGQREVGLVEVSSDRSREKFALLCPAVAVRRGLGSCDSTYFGLSLIFFGRQRRAWFDGLSEVRHPGSRCAWDVR